MMQHYKDSKNNLYAFKADESPKDWTDIKLMKITDAEAEKLRQQKQAPTKEQEVAEAEAKKQVLITEATANIAPLQDALDLDIATQEEVSALEEWKIYRVMLNRVDTSPGADVIWPMPPA